MEDLVQGEAMGIGGCRRIEFPGQVARVEVGNERMESQERF